MYTATKQGETGCTVFSKEKPDGKTHFLGG